MSVMLSDEIKGSNYAAEHNGLIILRRWVIIGKEYLSAAITDVFIFSHKH